MVIVKFNIFTHPQTGLSTRNRSLGATSTPARTGTGTFVERLDIGSMLKQFNKAYQDLYQPVFSVDFVHLQGILLRAANPIARKN